MCSSDLVIVGYKDTDLDGQNFILRIENAEDNVENSLCEIEKFVRDWLGCRVTSAQASDLIGAASKEQRRLAFMRRFARV